MQTSNLPTNKFPIPRLQMGNYHSKSKIAPLSDAKEGKKRTISSPKDFQHVEHFGTPMEPLPIMQVLAKELVRSRAAVQNLHKNKARRKFVRPPSLPAVAVGCPALLTRAPGWE